MKAARMYLLMYLHARSTHPSLLGLRVASRLDIAVGLFFLVEELWCSTPVRRLHT